MKQENISLQNIDMLNLNNKSNFPLSPMKHIKSQYPKINYQQHYKKA